MFIGNDECYLRIERSASDPWYAPVRVEARLRIDERAEFFAVSCDAMISSGEPDRVAFTEFKELRSHGVHIAMSDDGSIELRRDSHGNIDVLFSIGYRRLGPHWKTSGDVHVDGEYTQAFLRDLENLLFVQ